MPKITRRLVDKIEADPTRDQFIWDAGDGAVKGFGIRVKPSGSASYLVQYRNSEGRTRRMVIGKVTTLTPDEARKRAIDELGAVTKGADPSADRKAIRQSITVADLCDLYIKSAAGRVKDSTLAMDQSRIVTHVKPLIGNLTVRSLTTADIERMQAAITAGKTARPRKDGRGGVATGGAGVASRTVGMLGTILEYGRRPLGLIKENPARGVKRPADGRQRRFLTLEEIGILGNAIKALEAEGENPTALAAIRILLMTGLRRMEALALPSAWVDKSLSCIRFEDTKSGAQLRAIGASAIAELGKIPARESSKWVFPAGNGDGHFVGLPRVLQRVCDRAGLEGITVHVLRHTFAATAAQLGFSELTIAGLLGHSVPGVTARYAHIPDSALVAAADKVSEALALELGSGIPQSSED